MRELEDPAVWSDPDRAQALGKERAQLEETVQTLDHLTQGLKDAGELLELVLEEGDEDTIASIAADLENHEKTVFDLEFRRMFSGQLDQNNAFLDIQAGSGGTEAQDWAEMLLRMYTRWAERRGYQVEVLDLLEGEEAGIKSATVLISGPNAYGFLKAEKGVHRLVRISPFDASGRRHTSFASVDVMPEVAEENEVEIAAEDLRIDTFRASGAGGQHVNKTESAVRITHIPTGIVVSCQNERSQHANRLTAMKILRARLLELRERERAEEMAALRGEQQEIAWGSQIRSYVFQPYSLVKDHRTNVETGNVQAVMDGAIDAFVYAYLQRLAAADRN